MIHTVVFDDEIKVWWDCVKGLSKNDKFCIVKSGEEFIVSKDCSNKTFFNLIAETAYSFSLFLLKDGKKYLLDSVIVKTLKRKNYINVTLAPYNAIGDDNTDNRAAIQKALDDCTENDCIYFPSGVYCTGALDVHGNTEIRLDDNAVLQGSYNCKDYLPKIKSRFEGTVCECYKSLINIGTLDEKSDCNVFNITIRGGKILGGGERLRLSTINTEKTAIISAFGYQNELNPPAEYSSLLPGRKRGRLVHIANASNVIVADCEFGESPSWNFHAIFCKNITTCGCKIISRGISNGDGWDPDSSENCVIFDTVFDTGDDCVAIKSGKNLEGCSIGRPSKDIKIFDCLAIGGHGVAIGSEMSGGVENVEIWNCDLERSNVGIHIKTNVTRGGYVRDINVYNCLSTAIRVDSIKMNNDGESASHPPIVENLNFERITLTGLYHMTNRGRSRKGEFVYLTGYSGDYKVKNVLLKNIKLKHNLLSPFNYVSIENCENVQIENIQSVNL